MSEQNETVPAAAEEQKPVENTEEKAEKSQENGSGDATDVKEPEAETPKDMRAIILTGFGGLKTVKVMKKPEPSLNEGEVLIRVKACGLNFQDLMVRQGAIDSPPKCPFILGFECAGEIEQVAEGVEGLKVGDLVVALPEFRAWAEVVSVPAAHVFLLPTGMSPLDAVAIAMNYVVAYMLLFDLGHLQPHNSVLLHSAAGGVGQAVGELCRTVDDVTVFGVCSKAKHDALKAADSPIHHLLDRTSDYTSEVRKISPDGVDIVLDCLCGEECNRGYGLLKPMGRYILYGSSNIVTGETKSFFSAARSWWQVDKVSPIKLFEDNKSLSGLNLRHLLFQQGSSEYVHRAMEKVFALWSQGKVKPVVDSTWALEDVAEAMQKMHDRKNIGKIVLDPALEPKPKPATPAKGKDKKKQTSEEKKDAETKKEEDGNGKETDNKQVNGSEDNADSDSKEKDPSS